ncbi:hypothetical protein LYSIN_01902 [Lysinibacillus sphaericus]|uniref:Uncharacterized protein n=1 Tax=Lysinibacillus sphaericus TaxID=1421 RepID=A0A2S5D218_LYSSH|nr:hypothetical protein LYSIN_01902 [Lysinibacillus sphaericus]
MLGGGQEMALDIGVLSKQYTVYPIESLLEQLIENNIKLIF